MLESIQFSFKILLHRLLEDALFIESKGNIHSYSCEFIKPFSSFFVTETWNLWDCEHILILLLCLWVVLENGSLLIWNPLQKDGRWIDPQGIEDCELRIVLKIRNAGHNLDTVNLLL